MFIIDITTDILIVTNIITVDIRIVINIITVEIWNFINIIMDNINSIKVLLIISA